MNCFGSSNCQTHAGNEDYESVNLLALVTEGSRLQSQEVIVLPFFVTEKTKKETFLRWSPKDPASSLRRSLVVILAVVIITHISVL